MTATATARGSGEGRRLRDRIFDRVGGRARAKVVVALACVLALDTADIGAVGSMAGKLEEALGISHWQVGLILTLSEGVGAIATLLYGWLVDRTNRTRLLAIMAVLWGVAVAVCGFATGYVFLLLARIGVGAVTAAATPAVASLLGDYIPQRDRAKVYGAVLAGEVVGTGFGFLAAGLLSSISWRLGFWVLAVPALPLAWAMHAIPEPARGGASEIGRGEGSLDVVRRGAREHSEHPEEARRRARERTARRFVADEARRRGVGSRDRLVRDEDPSKQSLWWAVKYVLSIPTNLTLIVASTLGYFFFSGARVFGVELLRDQLDLSHAAALALVVALGSGAAIGVVGGGWASDRLLSKGYLRARVQVAVGAALFCAVVFTVGLVVMTFWSTAVFFFLGAAALGALNPSIDAARLDVVAGGVWGRAESVRMALRKAGEAGAPLLVGWLAGVLSVNGAAGDGLRNALLLVTIPLFVGGMVGLYTFGTYLTDAVSAAEYSDRVRRRGAEA